MAKNGSSLDEMSIEEIEAALKAKKAKAAASKADSLRVVGLDAKKYLKDVALPQYFKKKYPNNPEYHTLSLADIFTASGTAREPETYRHPETSELYTYYGRGKKPGWTEGLKPTKAKAAEPVVASVD